jgi:hypothetical protein
MTPVMAAGRIDELADEVAAGTQGAAERLTMLQHGTLLGWSNASA